jgi:hypothetical protein
MRPRLDASANYMEGTLWNASHEIATIPYGTPLLMPLYSDERTGQDNFTLRAGPQFNRSPHILAISGDFPQHSRSDEYRSTFSI